MSPPGCTDAEEREPRHDEGSRGSPRYEDKDGYNISNRGFKDNLLGKKGHRPRHSEDGLGPSSTVSGIFVTPFHPFHRGVEPSLTDSVPKRLGYPRLAQRRDRTPSGEHDRTPGILSDLQGSGVCVGDFTRRGCRS